MEGTWLHVIPPEGAARQAALDLCEAAHQSEPAGLHKRFDTKPFLDGFAQLLKHPTDDMRVDLMNQALVIAALEHRTAVVCVTSLAPVTLFTLRLLRQQGMTLIHWMVEDYRVATYWRQVLSAYHAVFSIQSGDLAEQCRNLNIPCSYLPTAFSPQVLGLTLSPVSQRPHDFVFIGLPSPYRLAVLDALRLAGADIRVGGSGWERVSGPLSQKVYPGDFSSPQQSLQVQAQARYGLHIPYENPAEGRAQSHLSPRHFDMLALGCPLISEESPLVRLWLEPYPCHWYQGPQQAISAWHAARDSLSRPGFEGGIAHAAMRRARTQESYAQRWQQMKKDVEKLKLGCLESSFSAPGPIKN
jgi:hypothetical protein